MKTDYQIDITNDNCPMTFVRTKVQLEKMTEGQLLAVTLRDGEPLVNVPRAVRDHGHDVIELNEQEAGVYCLVIRVGSR